MSITKQLIKEWSGGTNDNWEERAGGPKDPWRKQGMSSPLKFSKDDFKGKRPGEKDEPEKEKKDDDKEKAPEKAGNRWKFKASESSISRGVRRLLDES